MRTILLVLAVIAFAIAALEPAIFTTSKIVFRDVGFALVTASFLF